jgi:outer membrane receptor protein involved in Fe transport
MELGMKFDLGKSTDRFQIPDLGASLNVQTVRLVYAFQGAGQARVEGSREEERLGRTLDSYPYELTGGRVAGKTWTWRLGFDYRVTQFVQASATYDGRTEGGAPPVHTARAEVRAFF